MRIIILCCIAILVFAATGFAQDIPNGSCGIRYTYDATGNRTKMEYVCINGGRMSAVDSATSTSKQTSEIVEVEALYPNPTSGKFWITFTQPIQNEQLYILDSNGRPIQKVIGNGTRAEFDLSTLPNGLYFISIEMPNGKILTKKVLKF